MVNTSWSSKLFSFRTRAAGKLPVVPLSLSVFQCILITDTLRTISTHPHTSTHTHTAEVMHVLHTDKTQYVTAVGLDGMADSLPINQAVWFLTKE